MKQRIIAKKLESFVESPRGCFLRLARVITYCTYLSDWAEVSVDCRNEGCNYESQVT